MTFQNRNQFTGKGSDDVGSFTFKNGKITGGFSNANIKRVYVSNRWKIASLAGWLLWVWFYDTSSSSHPQNGVKNNILSSACTALKPRWNVHSLSLSLVVYSFIYLLCFYNDISSLSTVLAKLQLANLMAGPKYLPTVNSKFVKDLKLMLTCKYFCMWRIATQLLCPSPFSSESGQTRQWQKEPLYLATNLFSLQVPRYSLSKITSSTRCATRVTSWGYRWRGAGGFSPIIVSEATGLCGLLDKCPSTHLHGSFPKPTDFTRIISSVQFNTLYIY